MSNNDISNKVIFPEDGFVRANQILGNSKKGIPPFLPVSRAHWFQGIKEGKYPRGVKLSERVTVWKAEDIRGLVEDLALSGEPK